MNPVTSLCAEVRERVRIVLFDIDDTITVHGRLPACAYRGIERLHEADLITIAVTGRPAGWCDHIARMWPVDGIVGENGAFYFRYDQANGRMRRRFWLGEGERRQNRERLDTIATEVLQCVPAARIASDQAYREADLAVDICEDVPPLSSEDIETIHAIFARHGATTKTSSIHVNGWFGTYDKCSMALRMLAAEFGMDETTARARAIYVGDSPNDVPMFECFEYTVGVANIRQFLPRLRCTPRWVTSSEGGFGFSEFTDVLLKRGTT